MTINCTRDGEHVSYLLGGMKKKYLLVDGNKVFHVPTDDIGVGFASLKAFAGGILVECKTGGYLKKDVLDEDGKIIGEEDDVEATIASLNAYFSRTDIDQVEASDDYFAPILEDDLEASIADANARLGRTDIDHVELVDEEAEQAAYDAAQAQAEEDAETYANSPEGIAARLKAARDSALSMMRDNSDLSGSWPQLKNALNQAVDDAGDDYTADAIYSAAVTILES